MWRTVEPTCQWVGAHPSTALHTEAHTGDWPATRADSLRVPAFPSLSIPTFLHFSTPAAPHRFHYRGQGGGAGGRGGRSRWFCLRLPGRRGSRLGPRGAPLPALARRGDGPDAAPGAAGHRGGRCRHMGGRCGAGLALGHKGWTIPDDPLFFERSSKPAFPMCVYFGFIAALYYTCRPNSSTTSYIFRSILLPSSTTTLPGWPLLPTPPPRLPSPPLTQTLTHWHRRR